jgi:hypothetical protein
MQDFQTKKGRLTKRDYKADFRLADSDDFFGFTKKNKTPLLVKQLYAGIIGYTLFYTYQAITYIF